MEESKISILAEDKRKKTFHEVSLGYAKRVALNEARQCLQCAEPYCRQVCPLDIDIPGFIRFLREGNVTEAYKVIKESSALPAICGRICSAPCESRCVLTDENFNYDIRTLERYASDKGRKSSIKREENSRNPKRIAIVGSGPAGLSAAFELAKKNYQVTIYESLKKPGGVLRYGIPEFRIPRKVLDAEIDALVQLGVEIKTNHFIGQTVTIGELQQQGYEAVLLTTGAGVPKFTDIKGSNLGSVYYGEEFLMRINLSKKSIFKRATPNFSLGNKVAVIGSGNTALDCARSARRMGCEVSMVFRRTEEDIRARNQEKIFALGEGINFVPLTKPVEILSDSNHFATGLKCVRMDFADASEEGKWELSEVPESEHIIDCDTVIIAIGHQPNTTIVHSSGDLQLNQNGTLKVNKKNNMTTLEGVFAAGNVVSNAGPVVEAMASGKMAALQIHEYILNKI